jgi:hypothetical protein
MPIDDLCLEAQLLPLWVQHQASTALTTEKYCHHPLTDPLHGLATQGIQTSRLKHKCWQQVSTQLLKKAKISPIEYDNSLTDICQLSPTAPLHLPLM